MFPVRLFALFFLLGPSLLLLADDEIRVAVISENEPDLESLVRTKLGERKNLVLLERSDLPTLVRELSNALAGGELRLSGIDRLVVIGRAGDSQMVRVTDCSTGAVVYEASLPPKLNSAVAAEMLALRLSGQLERSPKADARRFALSGFRFAVSSPENRLLESRLNLACAVALKNTGDAVVLDRWRMRDLVFENTLREEAVGSFWNSAAMVQGLISKDGDRLTIKLEIKTPGAVSVRTEQVDGSVGDLQDLGGKLASAILKTASMPPVSSQSEAAAYLAETEWLLGHQLYKEAVQAVESAIALDPGSRAAAVLRIKAYAMAANGDDLRVRQFQSVRTSSESIRRENIGRAVEMATEMSRLAEDYLEKYPGTLGDRLEDPVSLGIRTLRTSLSTLAAAYNYDYFLKDPEAVETLRGQVERSSGILRQRATAIFRSNIEIYLTHYAGYWCPTPEAAIDEYRSRLGRDFESGFSRGWPDAVRISLANVSGRNPPLIDVDANNRAAARPENNFCRLVSWKSGGEKHVRDLWEAYLNELSASDDLLKQADGLFFRWSSLASRPSQAKVVVEVLDFMEKHPEVLLGKDGRAIAQMLTAPLKDLSYLPDGNQCVRYVDVLIKLFEQDERVPYEVLQWLPSTFGYRRNDDILPPHLERLIPVMTRHLAKWEGGKDAYYVSMFRQALSGLKGIAAKSAPERKNASGGATAGAGLKVNRLWPQQKYLGGKGRLNGSSGALVDDSIWFSQRAPLGFWKVNIESFETECLGGFDSAPPRLGERSTLSPFFQDGRIFITAAQDAWSYDPQSKQWRRFGLPETDYLLYHANGALWAVFGKGPFFRTDKEDYQGTGLYRLDTKNLTATLAFSTRRRPAEHPLDETEIAAPLGVFSGSDGQPIVGLVGKEWKFASLKDGSPWPLASAEKTQDRFLLPERALLFQRPSATPSGKRAALFESLISVDSQGRSELLLAHPGVVSPLGLPVWKLPESLSAAPDFGSRRFHPVFVGNRLVVLVAEMEGSTEDFTSSTELYVFERGKPEPVRIPLQFEIPAEAVPYLKNGRQDMAKKALNPAPGFNRFLSSAKGFVYTQEWGFWFIPMADFEQALAAAAKETVAK